MTASVSTSGISKTMQNVSIEATSSQPVISDEALTAITKNISEETLTILGGNKKDLKINRTLEGDPSAAYPEGARKFLVLKDLYRKKLSLATAIIKADQCTKEKIVLFSWISP